ncbi:MAG: hypothetical protein ABIP36_05580 [Acidimicrobiales bacterium]
MQLHAGFTFDDAADIVPNHMALAGAANLDARPREMQVPTGARLVLASDPEGRLGVDGLRVPVDSVVLLRTPEEPAER